MTMVNLHPHYCHTPVCRKPGKLCIAVDRHLLSKTSQRFPTNWAYPLEWKSSIGEHADNRNKSSTATAMNELPELHEDTDLASAELGEFKVTRAIKTRFAVEPLIWHELGLHNRHSSTNCIASFVYSPRHPCALD